MAFVTAARTSLASLGRVNLEEIASDNSVVNSVATSLASWPERPNDVTISSAQAELIGEDLNVDGSFMGLVVFCILTAGFGCAGVAADGVDAEEVTAAGFVSGFSVAVVGGRLSRFVGVLLMVIFSIFL
jgi:hypothetical protein